MFWGYASGLQPIGIAIGAAGDKPYAVAFVARIAEVNLQPDAVRRHADFRTGGGRLTPLSATDFPRCGEGFAGRVFEVPRAVGSEIDRHLLARL